VSTIFKFLVVKLSLSLSSSLSLSLSISGCCDCINKYQQQTNIFHTSNDIGWKKGEGVIFAQNHEDENSQVGQSFASRR